MRIFPCHCFNHRSLQKRIHIASKFSCPKCSKKCITKQIYEKHVQFCEKKTDPCNNCGQWFKDLFALERHVALGCGYKNFETSNAVRKYNMRPVKLGLPVVKCSDCGKEFHGAENLRTHVTRIHQENKCDICGIIIFGNSKFRWHKVCFDFHGYHYMYDCRSFFFAPACCISK